MVNPLTWVLHARYMHARIDRGTNNYGDQEFGSPCPPPLIFGKSENPNTSNQADVSRGTFRYFNPQQYLRGAPVSLGGMDGTVEASNVNKQAVNRVVNFMNKDYALIGDKVYVWSGGVGAVGSWSTSLTLTAKTGTNTNSLGLYPVFVNNKPYLVAAWNQDLNGGANQPDWVANKLDGDTGIWQPAGSSPILIFPNDSQGGILTECQHKNRIYFLTSDTTSFFWYDFVNETFGSRAWGTTVRHPMELCSFMGHLYAINKDTSGNVRIYNLNDGRTTPTLVSSYGRSGSFPWGTFNETLTTTNQFEGRPLMFVDNVLDSKLNNLEPRLYTAYITHAASPQPDDANQSSYGLQWEPFKPDGAGGLINVAVPGFGGLAFRANPFKCNKNQQGSLQPSCLACLPVLPSVKDERIVLRTFVDQKTRDVNLSGTTAIVVGSRFAGQLCGGSPGGGGDFNNQFYHKFIGSGNLLGGNLPDQPQNGGGRHALQFIGFPKKQVRHRAAAHERHGGGARHSVLDGNNNKIADIVYRGSDSTNQDGVIRIKYSIIPSVANPSGSIVATRWFYDENGHAPEDLCTLVGTSHGSLSGSFIAADVPVDSGIMYYVDWQAKGDGLTRGSRINLNGMLILADVSIGPISTPSGLPGLTAWYEANDANTITSGVTNQVSSWLNKAVLPSGTVVPMSGVFQATSGNQPLLVPNANNSLDGVRFRSTNSEFLFGIESPIPTNDTSTIMIIYEPNSLTSTDTMFSLSQDTPLSGVVIDPAFLNASVIAGGTSDLLLEAQDSNRKAQAQSPRIMTLASGGEISKARLLMWTEIAFESTGQVHPSGDTALTDVVVDGFVEQTGLANTTFGRFSGAQVSGVYTGAGQYADVTIYEVAVYNQNLSDEDLDKFRVYAENKYTLTV